MSTDNVLKLYSKTIQSSFLHYGFWDDPEKIDLSTLSLQDIKNAQYRYIDHLASFIPSETKTILDVGCGIGGNTSFLLKKGYSLEALSPDSYQKSVIKEKSLELQVLEAYEAGIKALIDDSDNLIATSVTNVSGDDLTISGTVAGEGKFYKLVFADKKITFKVDARIFSTLSVKQPLEINGTTTYNGEILSKDSSDNSITVLFPSTMTDYNLKNYNFTIFGNPIFSRQVKISLMISYLSDQVRQLRSDLL